MSRKSYNRPTATNYQDYLLSFDDVDFSRLGGQQGQSQEEEPGFWDKAWESGKAFAEGLTFLPGGIDPGNIKSAAFAWYLGANFKTAVLNLTQNIIVGVPRLRMDTVAEELMPVALKNGMQAYRLMTEGQTTMTGRPINDPGKRGARKLTEAEAVGKFLGFQPVSSTKSYDVYQAQKRKDEVCSDKIDELTVLALKTVDTGDPTGRREMNRELREWNERMRAEGKPYMLITAKDVMKRVKSRRRENRPTPKAMRKQRTQAEVWG